MTDAKIIQYEALMETFHAVSNERDRLREINAGLLAALKRAEQYLELTLMEEAAEDPHSTASRNVGGDLDVIRAAIARAEADQ